MVRADFVLSLAGESVDPGPAYACRTLGTSRTETIAEILLVEVVPAFRAKLRDGTVAEFDVVLLALHLGDEPLTAITSWPAHVYILLPRAPEARVPGAALSNQDLAIQAWGDIYPPSALEELRRIHGLEDPEQMDELGELTMACQQGRFPPPTRRE